MLVHTRRGFERAKESEAEAVAEALALIGAMYRHEKQTARTPSPAPQNESIERFMSDRSWRGRLKNLTILRLAVNCEGRQGVWR